MISKVGKNVSFSDMKKREDGYNEVAFIVQHYV